MSTKASSARRAARRFARLLYGTITTLAVLAGALTAANMANEPQLNSTSLLAHSSTRPGFAVYSLQRDDRLDRNGTKRPDTIRGESLSGRGDGTVLVRARRIQEYVVLPSALAVDTLNDDNTSSLEIIPFAGGSPVQVPLPGPGTVENLHASGSKHLIGYSFTSSKIADGYWKTLFVYDPTDPSEMPRKVLGIDGHPISVFNWTFIPGTTSLVAQTDDHSMYLVDALGTGPVTPLGLHAEIRNFIPGTQELFVADRMQTSTMNLATGAVTPLDLPDGARSASSYPGKTVLLDANGRYVQVSSEYAEGRESSRILLTDTGGSEVLYQPAPAWSRILNYCASPDGKYLAVETTSPDGASDQYPNLPGSSPMKTVFVNLTSGTSTRSVSGFLPSWCR